MTIDELRKLIAQGENETVEFKASGRLLVSTLGRTITGFLNSKGGVIIVGVQEPDQIVGVDEELIERLRDFAVKVALKRIRPLARISFNTVTVTKKKVVVIEIPEGKSKPYGYGGDYFKREGEVTIEMAQSDLLDFYSSAEKYDKRTITEIFEKVKSIETVIRETQQRKHGSNVFISHGHHPEILDKVVECIESLELNPIVVKDEASEGMSVDDKVEKFIKKCDMAVVLYTPDDELKDGKFLPRQNVIHETGILQREMHDKIVYVKEKSVSLPTNITPKVYVSFEGNNLTDVFIQIIKEFKSFGAI